MYHSLLLICLVRDKKLPLIKEVRWFLLTFAYFIIFKTFPPFYQCNQILNLLEIYIFRKYFKTVNYFKKC